MKLLLAGAFYLIVFYLILMSQAEPAMSLAAGLPMAIASGMLFGFGTLDVLENWH
jgi:ABC-type uncharacterized transport system permease subunit